MLAANAVPPTSVFGSNSHFPKGNFATRAVTSNSCPSLTSLTTASCPGRSDRIDFNNPEGDSINCR